MGFFGFAIRFVRTTVWRPSGKNRLNLISDKTNVPRVCHYIRYTFHDCFRSNGLSNICFPSFSRRHALAPYRRRRQQRVYPELFTVCSNTTTVPLCHCVPPPSPYTSCEHTDILFPFLLDHVQSRRYVFLPRHILNYRSRRPPGADRFHVLQFFLCS